MNRPNLDLNTTNTFTESGPSISGEVLPNGQGGTHTPTKGLLQKMSEFAASSSFGKGLFATLIASTVISVFFLNFGAGLLFLGGLCLALYLRHLLLRSQSIVQIEFSPAHNI